MGPRSRATDGTVFVEFIVAFMPFFLLFLGGVQLALIAQARIVVQHAASQAARAAVVAIDDDPIFYEDGKRKMLSGSGSGQGSDGAQKLVEGLSASSAPKIDQSGKGSTGSGRLNRVRNAAYLPLSVLGPSPQQALAWLGGALSGRKASVADAIGDAPLLRVLMGVALYGRVAAAVTFPKSAHGDELRDPEQPFSDTAPVYVRVSYLFPCGVPLVRNIACSSLLELKIAAATGSLFTTKEASARHAQDLRELEQAEWAGAQIGLLALVHERFMVLRGEAALPNQGAAYRYPSELCKTEQTAPGTSCGGKKR